MTISSNATVPTAHASRYLQQLCKHWRHNLTVEFSETKGTIIFPRNARGADWPGDAALKLQAHENLLECCLVASSAGQLDALKGSHAILIASHFVRHRSPSNGKMAKLTDSVVHAREIAKEAKRAIVH